MGELLPDILPQIGSDHLNQLKDYAEKFEALKPNNEDDDGVDGVDIGGGDDGDVPMLIDEDLNFEAVAQSDEKKEESKDDVKTSDDAANDASKTEDVTVNVTEDVTVTNDNDKDEAPKEVNEDDAKPKDENVEETQTENTEPST